MFVLTLAQLVITNRAVRLEAEIRQFLLEPHAQVLRVERKNAYFARLEPDLQQREDKQR